MAEARAMVAAGERVGVLFGPERAGLANEDVCAPTRWSRCRSTRPIGSLNLAQACC